MKKLSESSAAGNARYCASSDLVLIESRTTLDLVTSVASGKK
jgi:hypothetical protein